MRDTSHLNTIRNGMMVAQPRRNSGILDPLLPENRVPVFLKNPHGRIVEVQKWLAFDILNDHTKRGWSEASPEEYTQFEEEQKGREVELSQKYIDMMNEPVASDKVAKLESQISELTAAVQQLVTIQQSAQSAKKSPNQARRKNG